MISGQIKRSNQITLTGVYPRTEFLLDELIITHIDLKRKLQKLTPRQEKILCMCVENFTKAEIAKETGCSVRTVARTYQQLIDFVEGEF